jgi:regulatory protein
MSANRAFQAALRLLARRDFFAEELRQRLIRKGLETDAATAAVARCADRDLLDDERLAHRFVELKAVARGWGPRRLTAELMRRGVERELAERAGRLEPGIGREALRVAVERVERRLEAGWWELPERRARMVSSLVSRGFETEEAYAAVAELAAERERHDHALDDQPGDPGRIP